MPWRDQSREALVTCAGDLLISAGWSRAAFQFGERKRERQETELARRLSSETDLPRRCRRLSGRFRDRYDGSECTSPISQTAASMTDDSEDFRRLMDAVLAGDGAALASLFSMYRERLRRMVELRMDSRLRGAFLLRTSCRRRTSALFSDCPTIKRRRTCPSSYGCAR